MGGDEFDAKSRMGLLLRAMDHLITQGAHLLTIRPPLVLDILVLLKLQAG